MVKVCTAELKSITPYSQSRMHDTPKLDKENHEDYEKRTWIEKGHYDEDGLLYLPPMAFKQAVDAAAKFLSIQIPGKGKATYTKHFASGLLVMDKLITDQSKDDTQGEWINANSDGVRGSGKRVKRCFPVIPSWSGKLDFYLLDNTITADVFEEVLKTAGQLIGVGRFRPQNGGFYGRFSVEGVNWREE